MGRGRKPIYATGKAGEEPSYVVVGRATSPGNPPGEAVGGLAGRNGSEGGQHIDGFLCFSGFHSNKPQIPTGTVPNLTISYVDICYGATFVQCTGSCNGIGIWDGWLGR